MVASTAERSARATYQDVLDAPAHLVAEIINGNAPHPTAAGVATRARDPPNLGVELGSPFGKRPRRSRRVVDHLRTRAAPR